MKTCTGCLQTKELVDFPPDKVNCDGRKGKCRACVLQRQRELRAAHPEHDREWVRNNHDRVLAQKRAYRERNADKLRVDGRVRARRKREDNPEQSVIEAARTREYHKRHREEIAAKTRQQRSAAPEKFRARERFNHELRAGRIVRASTCERCGQPHECLHAHHDDYSRPLDVKFLCPKCHRRYHAAKKLAADSRIEVRNGKVEVVS